MDIFQLDTPTLLVDKTKMEQNLQNIKFFANNHGINWRPHIKTHKSVYIAKRQLAYGARGITVAKLSEAEVMLQAGITDILIAYPISSKLKIERLLLLLEHGNIKAAVDSQQQAAMLQTALAQTGQKLEVWIKVNCGLNRCGVEPVEETVELAAAVQSMNNLVLRGIFTHAGQSYGAVSEAQLSEIAKAEALAVIESANACEKIGIPIAERSVGSTPTFTKSGQYQGITEVRPGNAVFFDSVQVGLGIATVDQCALTVLATVVSVKSKWLVLDTGSKALSLDQGAHGNQSVKGFGTIIGFPDLTIERLSEEHGVVSFEGSPPLQLGDVVEIIPNHACTAVNLFDEYVVHQQHQVTGSISVDARGKGK